MDHYHSDNPDAGDDKAFSRVMRVAWSLISLSVLALIVYWTVSLSERTIDDLPIIASLQDEIRVKPEIPGGQEVEFKDLSLNEVFEPNIKNLSLKKEVSLAPQSEIIFENEKSPALEVDGQLAEDNDLIGKSITAALETLLGVNREIESLEYAPIELHIASHSTVDEANAHWFLLQQLNSDLLENYNHNVVRIKGNLGDIFRLRIEGFKTLAVAREMCAQLIERGENCILSETREIR